MAQRILLIEDDARLSQMLAEHLEAQGYEVCLAFDGREGLSQARAEPFDLLILDRGLPELDGLSLCRSLRAEKPDMHILMLTALADELDLVVGLENGADDYVTKPFKLAELMARVKALLRRSQRVDHSESLAFNGLRIQAEMRRASFEDRDIALTAREFDVLAFLSDHPGRVFTREDILRCVWETEALGYEESVSTIVKRLRRKLKEVSGTGHWIETIRGIGYRFNDS